MLWKAPIFSFLKNVFEMMTGDVCGGDGGGGDGGDRGGDDGDRGGGGGGEIVKRPT